MADLYIPPKPAIIRATELPRSPAEARGIALREAFGPAPVFPRIAKRKAAPPEYEFLTFASDPGNLTTYNGAPFQGLSFGAASADRQIAVGVFVRFNGGTAISGVSAGGVSLTKRVGVLSSDTISSLEIWSGNVPSGTTGNVVVTLNGQGLRCSIGLYRLAKLGNPVPESTNTSVANPLSLNLTASKDAILLAFGAVAATSSFTHSGTSEDFDTQPETSNTFSGGSAIKATAGTATITLTPASSSQNVGVSASFR